MNSTPQPESPRAVASEDLTLQYRRLRMLTHAIAIAVLILSGTMMVFLYRQVALVRKQTAEYGKFLAEVERSGLPDFMEQVRDRFNTYRKEHPDFNPIYIRYFGTNEPPPARERVSAIPAGSPERTEGTNASP